MLKLQPAWDKNFRFVGFYDSIKTWWNSIGKIKLEISSSFKLLLFMKRCFWILLVIADVRSVLDTTDSLICSSIFRITSLLLRITKPVPFCALLWNNKIRILKKSGLIGLSSMVIRMLCSVFETQSHCRSIDLKSGSKNV